MNNASPTPPSHQESGISFPEIASLLYRRKLTVAAFAGAALILVGFLSFKMAPTYETSTKILFENRFSDLSPLGNLFKFSASSPASAEIEVIRSRANIGNLIGQFNADGSHTGLGLTQRVDDVNSYWTSQRLMRKIAGRGEPVGTIQVWTDRQLPPAGVSLEFLENGKVEISLREFFGHSEVYDFTAGKPLSFLRNQIHISGAGTQPGRMYHFYSDDFQETLRSVMSRISVNETLRSSGILDLRFSDRDPKRAAAVLDYLTSAYIAHSAEQLRRPSTQSREFIESEIDSVRADLQNSEQHLIKFQSEQSRNTLLPEAALITAAATVTRNAEGTASTVLPEAALVLVKRMAALDLNLARKKYSLQEAQQAFQSWESGELSIEAALIACASNSAPGVFNPLSNEYEQGNASDPVAMNLISELAQLRATHASLALEYSSKWPGLKKLEAQIVATESKMASKIRAALLSLTTESNALENVLSEYKKELGTFPETDRKIAGLQREVLAFEKIYSLLITRLKDASIAEKAAVSPVEIIDPAIIPTKPILPRPALFSALGAILGALLGMVFVIAREATIKPILNARQLEGVTGYAQVGVIPDFRKGRAKSKGASGKMAEEGSFLALRDAPDSPTAEAYRSLRANLSFLQNGESLKTICITSAGKGEGKSTATANLAIALARAGESILLIDADLRQPAQHQFFNVPVKGGLSELLRQNVAEQNAGSSDQSGLNSSNAREFVRQTGFENLSIISAGAAVANPGDLLASAKTAALIEGLAKQFDHVLIDAPPLLSVADAGSFLNRLDGVFLLSRSDFFPERLATAASKRLSALNAPVLGCILNGFRPPRNSGYGDGFAYGESRYANRKTDSAS